MQHDVRLMTEMMGAEPSGAVAASAAVCRAHDVHAAAAARLAHAARLRAARWAAL